MRCLVLLLLCFPALAQAIVGQPHLKKTIDSLASVDQKVQQDFHDHFRTDQRRQFEQIERETFSRHTPLLKQIVNKHGFMI